MSIVINIEKAKTIAHDIRRKNRNEEFASWDIKATIPSFAAQAELERQTIRDKYAIMQVNIDCAMSVDEIKLILNQ